MNRSWHWQLHKLRKNRQPLATVYDVHRTFEQASTITATMDPTTLITFLFKAPPEIRTVELLGSWDNFRQPYRMHHDRRRGVGFWSGCFKFHDIIFDGDSPNWSKPRTGGLKQGGTYWYFYRLNDEVEAYDDSQACTASCPLLPGQIVNVVDVPTEVVEPPARGRSASMNVAGTFARLPSTHTLDPGQKMMPLDPPPICKVHERCISDLALNGRLENNPQSVRAASRPVSPISDRTRTPSPVSPPPVSGRYYANRKHVEDDYADDRASLYSRRSSRRSWQSEAPSFAHSSVVDAFGIDSPWKHEHEDFPPPTFIQDASQIASDPTATADDDFENVAFEFNNQDDDSIISDSHSIIDDQAEVASTFAPASIQNIQIYGSRPTTSRSDSPPWRPRLYSLHNSELRTHTVCSPNPSMPQFSPRQSDDTDVPTPTFSAATVSSSGGGLNTPFRLSVGNSRGTSAHANADATNDDSIESVAERLRSLSSDADDAESTPHAAARSATLPVAEKPSTFTTYALPRSNSHSLLGKLNILNKLKPARPTSIAQDISVPTLVVQDESSSFADSIFSELGFLGGSIN